MIELRNVDFHYGGENGTGDGVPLFQRVLMLVLTKCLMKRKVLQVQVLFPIMLLRLQVTVVLE